LGSSGEERYSELVTIITDHIQHTKVSFTNSFAFNNSREPNKPGEVLTLTFEQNKASVEKDKSAKSGSRFVSGKKGQAFIHYA